MKKECGLPGVNGTYEPLGEMSPGFMKYVKEGYYEGISAIFEIYFVILIQWIGASVPFLGPYIQSLLKKRNIERQVIISIPQKMID